MHWETKKKKVWLTLFQYSLYCRGLEPNRQFLWGWPVYKWIPWAEAGGCLVKNAAARVQPRQDPGGTLRMNGVGEREKTRDTSLDRAKSARERERVTRPDRGVQLSLAESGNALFFYRSFYTLS